MTEYGGAPTDGATTTDDVSYVVTNESGEVAQAKGPDPNVWGSDDERPVAAGDRNPADEGPGYDEVWYENTPEQIKGPDGSWRERHNNPEGETSEG